MKNPERWRRSWQREGRGASGDQWARVGNFAALLENWSEQVAFDTGKRRGDNTICLHCASLGAATQPVLHSKNWLEANPGLAKFNG